MTPTSTAPPAAPKPPKPQLASVPPGKPQSGAATVTTAPPPNAKAMVDRTIILDLSIDGEEHFAECIFRIESVIVGRLMTRTGRATKEEMIAELPRYVERIVKRALENEVY